MKTFLTSCKWSAFALSVLLTWNVSTPAAATSLSSRLASLEEDVEALRRQAQSQQGRLQAIRQDHGSRVVEPAWLAGGAFALAGLGAAWFLRRRTHGAPRYRSSASPSVFPLATPQAPGARVRPTSVDIPLDLAPGTLRRYVSTPVQPAGLRFERLSRVLQQADLFRSLGQHEQAARVLAHYVDQTPEPPHLALLELNLAPHGAPEWRRGQEAALEDSPSILADLQALWPRREVVQEIESVLLDRGSDGDGLSHAAHRELLWLHQVARDLVEHEEGRLQPVVQAVPAQQPVSPDAGEAAVEPLPDVELFDTATSFERPLRSSEARA